MLAPSRPYGVSTLAEDWSGTVSRSIATLERVIVDIVRGLARHGFRRFVLTNHPRPEPGENSQFKDITGEINEDEP